MALADVMHALREEAAKERAALEAEIQTAVGEIETVAKARENDVGWGAKAEAEAALRPDVALVEAETQRAADSSLRAAQEAVYQSCLTAVRERLARAREAPDWTAQLGALFDEALVALPDARLLRCVPDDAEALRAHLAARGLDLEVETTLTGWGGVELDAGDGRRVDNTLETRLSCADAELRRRCHDHLQHIGHHDD
jgi:vacuolar-type H+-ATPase subunit E/Vma4